MIWMLLPNTGQEWLMRGSRSLLLMVLFLGESARRSDDNGQSLESAGGCSRPEVRQWYQQPVQPYSWLSNDVHGNRFTDNGKRSRNRPYFNSPEPGGRKSPPTSRGACYNDNSCYFISDHHCQSDIDSNIPTAPKSYQGYSTIISLVNNQRWNPSVKIR